MVKKLSVAFLCSSICCSSLVGQYESTLDFVSAQLPSYSDDKVDVSMKIEDIDAQTNKQAEIDLMNKQIEQQNLILEEQRRKAALG